MVPDSAFAERALCCGVREKTVFCWSGGKDSALALYKVLRDERYSVVSLLTTCNERFGRVSMHGVRLELVQAQARAIGLPLDVVSVRPGSSNEEYERKMSACLLKHKEGGVTSVAFGDIFLEDLRHWREQNLARIGMNGLFPLWKIDTRKVIDEFINLGFRSIVCCVSDAYLGEAALGRAISWDFINALPVDVDPCGENGEFHSFAYAGPVFDYPIDVAIGKKVYRPVEQTQSSSALVSSTVCPLPSKQPAKGFWFCDLLPASGR
ncbi:MAG: diphthine--ammonia ligase [Candidatus Cybelea sp.]